MAERLRTPALAPPPVRPAVIRDADPSASLIAHFEAVWRTRMSDLPFLHPGLSVAAIGFQRHAGDWLGIVVTPWFLNLVLMAGGGTCWQDIPAGERRHVALPCGTLQFLADDDPDIGPYQYCPLIAPVTDLPDMRSACDAAAEALRAVLTAPPVALDAAPPPEVRSVDPSARRGFLRRVVGRRD